MSHIEHIAQEIGYRPKNPAKNANIAKSEELSSDTLSQQLAKAEIRISQNIPKPNPCIEIHHNDFQIPVATFGNISLVVGKAKSRKTFLVSMFLAAVLKNNLMYNLSGKVAPDKSTILLFDTEQSKYHVHKVIKRVYSLAGINNNPELPSFKIYSLRKYNPEERLKLIQYAIYNTENVGFVVIDGIKDLLMDINNPYDSTNLSAQLLKWTEELGIHIMTVLHANKADNNARGHLGTELVNKAETVISVAKHEEDNNISIATCEYSRDIQFDQFAFSIDDKGLPVMEDDFIFSKTKNKRSPDPTDFEIPVQKEIIEKVFKDNILLGYEETWRGIKYVLSKYTIKIGDNKAKDWLTYFKNEGYVVKIDKKYKYAV